MTRLRWFLHRLTSLFRRHQRETDLDAELAFHLDAEAEAAADAGLSTADAARAARRSLGNITLAREDARATWTWRWLEELTQDVRYAVRVLRRRPVFAITAVLTLGLGIGATTALFSLVNNLMLKPLPVERPHELVRITRPGDANGAETYLAHETVRTRMTGLSGVAGMSQLDPRPTEIEIGADRTPAFVQMVTAEYFEVLGTRAFRGRVFTDQGAHVDPPAAVISHDYWQRQFGGAVDALGTNIRAYGATFTVGGIAEPGFRGADIDFPVDVWVPFDAIVEPSSPSRTRGRWIQTIARVTGDESLEALTSQATSLLDRPMEVQPVPTGFSRLRVRLRQPITLLVVLTVLVLVITCANVTTLALSGTSARARELKVRQALGASRSQVARQLLVEGCVLAVGAAGLAVVVAPWLSAALLSFLPPAQATALTSLRFAFDARTAAVILGLSASIGLMVGLTPAARLLMRGPARITTSGGGAGSRERALNHSLIAGEIALCTVLLITAAMFARSIEHLHRQDTGYVADALLVADVDKSPRSSQDEDWVERLHLIRDDIARLPGVQAVGFSHTGQLSGFSINGSVQVPGSGEPASTDSIEHRVSPSFLEAMGTRLLAGRDLTDTDDAAAPRVAVVTEPFANRYFGTTHVIGRQFTRHTISRGAEPVTVVGLVAGVKWHTLREDSPVIYYMPYRQEDSASVTFAIRSNDDLSALAAQIPAIVASVDAGMVTSDIVPFTDIVNRTLVVERLVAHVASAFAVFGLVIACVGLYGVLAFAVVRRTREIGLRIALGARPRSVEWLFLRETVILLLTGFAIGVPTAYLVTRSVSSLLFGLEPGDPTTTAAVMALLSVTALAASWIPARRAAAIDPMRALREE